MKEQNSSFNFDEWMQLAKEDPAAFEEKRQQEIQSVISKGTSQKRLEGLQWQIDQMRNSSTNPMAACLNISKHMWENVQGEDGLVESLNQLTGKAPRKEKSHVKAEVVQLQKTKESHAEKTD